MLGKGAIPIQDHKKIFIVKNKPYFILLIISIIITT